MVAVPNYQYKAQRVVLPAVAQLVVLEAVLGLWRQRQWLLL